MNSAIGAVIFAAFVLGCLVGASVNRQHEEEVTDYGEPKREAPSKKEKVPNWRRYIQSHLTHYKRNRYETRHHGNPNILWNRRTFWAVFFYTGITFALLVVNFRAADTAKDTEKRQLRGYLGAVLMQFSCGDCLPTENDQIQVLINNFGQTPLYIISGVISYRQYLEIEEFPNDVTGGQKATESIVPLSMVVFPRAENHAQFPVNDIARSMFYDARTGDYWLMVRGILRYHDVFGQTWDNLFCFIYDPGRYKINGGVVNCPKYNDETAAREGQEEEVKISPPIPPLPDVPEHRL